MNEPWGHYRQATGNRSIMVIVDSSDSAGNIVYSYRPWTLFSAFEHLGIPYQIFDLRDTDLDHDDLLSRSAIILVQHGIGDSLSSDEVHSLIDALHKGIGIVSFDDDAKTLDMLFRNILGFSKLSRANAASIVVDDSKHYITSSRDMGEIISFKRPVEYTSIEDLSPTVRTLLRSPKREPILSVAHFGDGRLVQFTMSPHVWLNEYLGFAEGLDDIFWRSIVWASRKPFCMNAMPPFVTCRIDDCSGSNSRYKRGEDSAVLGFRYIDALNEHGYIPNIGLFIDEISNEDSEIIKRKYDMGLAEFSAHAFGEYYEDGRTVTHFIYHRTHGVESTNAELAENFARLDYIYGRWHIAPSKVVNSHYQNPGLRALSYLKERGQTYVMFGGLFGKAYSDPTAYMWDQGPYGHPGYVFDNIPIPNDFQDVKTSDFFCAMSHPYKRYQDGKISDGDIDFLSGNVVFFNESEFNNLESAIKKAIIGIKRGLDNLFFGCLFTHEQRIAVLSSEEWNTILGSIDELTSNYHKIYKGYDYVAEYARNKCCCWISKVDYDSATKHISCTFDGRTDIPLQFYVFIDHNDSIRYYFESLMAFTDSITISVPMKE